MGYANNSSNPPFFTNSKLIGSSRAERDAKIQALEKSVSKPIINADLTLALWWHPHVVLVIIVVLR